MEIEGIEISPRKKEAESIRTMVAIPVSDKMKSDLHSLKDQIDVNETTRSFFKKLIARTKKTK